MPDGTDCAIGWSGTTGSHHLDLTYDTDFRPIAQTIDGTSASQISMGYDLDGLLTSAGLSSLHRQDNNALLDSTSLSSLNAWSRQDYNAYGELANLRYRWHGPVVDSTFLETMTRDDLGRIGTMRDTVTGDTSHTYGYVYTTAGRLREVSRDGKVVGRWSYDANGNRNAAAGPAGGAVDSATYDAQDRLLSYGHAATGYKRYSYSKNGELKQRSSSTDTLRTIYDELGNLTSAQLTTTPGGGHNFPGLTISYLIDGQNRRVGMKQNGVLQKIWLYQNGLNVVAELNGSGTLVSRFVYGSRPNVPDYMVQGSTTYRIISDQLGSVRRVVNASTGILAQRLEYDAWGNVTMDTAPGFQPFGFAGGLYDADTKLVRFGARDYDASVGRWTCKDPIRFDAQTTSLYSYAGSSPINMTDGTGLAYFGHRPLDGPPISIRTPYLDACDLELLHEQLFFGDAKGGNVGFFNAGRKGIDKWNHGKGDIHEDAPENLPSYVKDDGGYDDALMREALEKVEKRWRNDWDVVGCNCQDFADALRAQYAALLGARNKKKGSR